MVIRVTFPERIVRHFPWFVSFFVRRRLVREYLQYLSDDGQRPRRLNGCRFEAAIFAQPLIDAELIAFKTSVRGSFQDREPERDVDSLLTVSLRNCGWVYPPNSGFLAVSSCFAPLPAGVRAVRVQLLELTDSIAVALFSFYFDAAGGRAPSRQLLQQAPRGLRAKLARRGLLLKRRSVEYLGTDWNPRKISIQSTASIQRILDKWTRHFIEYHRFCIPGEFVEVFSCASPARIVERTQDRSIRYRDIDIQRLLAAVGDHWVSPEAAMAVSLSRGGPCRLFVRHATSGDESRPYHIENSAVAAVVAVARAPSRLRSQLRGPLVKGGGRVSFRVSMKVAQSTAKAAYLRSAIERIKSAMESIPQFFDADLLRTFVRSFPFMNREYAFWDHATYVIGESTTELGRRIEAEREFSTAMFGVIQVRMNLALQVLVMFLTVVSVVIGIIQIRHM